MKVLKDWIELNYDTTLKMYLLVIYLFILKKLSRKTLNKKE